MSGTGPSAPARSPIRTRWTAPLAVALGGLIAAWALASLGYPFGWDQGIFAWVGRVINEGGLPYRDAWEIKGPATYYVYAGVERLFGPGLWGIRVFDLLVLGLGAGATARVVARLADRAAAGWAAMLLVLWFASLTYWHSAQPDAWVAMLLAAGCAPLLLAGERAGARQDLGLGLVLGVAVLFKPIYAAFVLVPVVHGYAVHHGRIAPLARRLLVVAAAAALPVAVCLAWFWRNGALADLVECYLTYNAAIYSSGAALDLAGRTAGVLGYLFHGELLLLLLPAIGWGLHGLRRSDPLAFRLLATWAGVAFAGVLLQDKFFAYQWTPLFPPCVILATLGLRAALRDPRPVLHRAGVGLALLVLLRAVVHPAIEVANAAAYLAGLRDLRAYYHHFGVPGPDWEAAEHIRKQSRPGDALVVFGWNVDVLYMTGLPTVSRFAYSMPLMLGEGSSLRQRYRAEFLQAFRARPPEFLVVAPQDRSLTGRPMTLADFPELAALVETRYRREAQFGDLTLYRRLSGPPSAGGSGAGAGAPSPAA